MPKQERRGISYRAEGPRTPAEISHEQASRAAAKPASDVPPWEKPEHLKFLADLEAKEQSATATPLPKSRIRQRIVEPEDVVDPDYEPRPSIRAIRLQGRVNDMYEQDVRFDPTDANDRFGDDLRDLETITHGLIADPQNAHLISQLEELERRYRGR